LIAVGYKSSAAWRAINQNSINSFGQYLHLPALVAAFSMGHSMSIQAFGSSQPFTLQNLVQPGQKFIVAHRGSSGTAPENTLPALEQAVLAGARMIEIDVQITGDDQVILMHDPYLGRTTNGNGIIKSYSYQYISTLDAGSWFSEAYSTVRIPLLQDALHYLKAQNICVNIEIKPPVANEDFLYRVHRIIEIVQQADMLPSVLFSSFHHDSLKALKKNYSGVHTAAINLPGDKRLPSEISASIGCDAFVCSLRELNHRRDDDAAKHGLIMGIYTINTAEDYARMLHYQAQGMVSNFPERIAGFIKAGKKDQTQE
jgi:glycerophosphoryl diester phosphodiesterase